MAWMRINTFTPYQHGRAVEVKNKYFKYALEFIQYREQKSKCWMR